MRLNCGRGLVFGSAGHWDSRNNSVFKIWKTLMVPLWYRPSKSDQIVPNFSDPIIMDQSVFRIFFGLSAILTNCRFIFYNFFCHQNFFRPKIHWKFFSTKNSLKISLKLHLNFSKISLKIFFHQKFFSLKKFQSTIFHIKPGIWKNIGTVMIIIDCEYFWLLV